MDAQMEENQEELFTPGHRACHGCGMAVAVRHILEATGNRVVVVTPTGCLETFTSPYGFSPWRVPWIHHLFENGPAVASGVAAALKAQGKSDVRVITIGGDGSTFDIGFGSLSGMLERGDDILYICVENGAYMNTGNQRSGATPTFAATTTAPAGRQSMGKPQLKKDMPGIVASHGTAYVATASVAYLKDLKRKVKKAMTYDGPRYIQIDTPCPSGWSFASDQTFEVGRLGVNCGLIPLFEMENGSVTKVRKIKKQNSVQDYLKAQGRFKHLFAGNDGAGELEQLKQIAQNNIRKYGLVD